MDNALTLENVFHELMLREAKTEESKQFENARHEIMRESIIDTINYYSKRYERVDELER